MKRYIKCSVETPRAGIFWIIDNQIVSVYDEVNTSYNPLEQDDLLHKEVWNMLKHNYKCNNKVVPYDFYPRGRVMIYPVRNSSGEFQYYDCLIYGDSCILNNSDLRDIIIDDFRLYLKSCEVSFEGKFSVDGTHYTCHNCR